MCIYKLPSVHVIDVVAVVLMFGRGVKREGDEDEEKKKY
jgi:hypothetical protein